MSGIVAPSIVNYDWTVRINDPSYLNVSFPFRVEILSIWFTTQKTFGATNGLYEGVEDIETTERKLSLAAVKSKNSKTQHNPYDNPTDFVWMFDNPEWNDGPNEELKPTMWLGNPDDAAGRVGAWATGSWFGAYDLNLRSTAVAPIGKSRAFNGSWNESEWNENTYLADAAIMNVDEMLQLFVYNSGGDWNDYENDAKVTISVAYTGMWNEGAESAPAKPWTAWWND